MSPATAVRAPGVPRTLALALLSRVPPSVLGLLLVLQVHHLGHSYAVAGLCSGACALGMAACSPLLGRAIDRTGQTAVLTLTGLVVAVACLAFALLPAGAPAPLLIAVAAAIGAVQPPITSCARVLWRRILDRDSFNALVTLDASLQELAFMTGPLVLISMASATGAPAALATTGGLLGLCSLVFAGLPETRRLGGPQHDDDLETPRPAGGALSAPAVRLLLVVAVMMGVAFGATELGIVTTADHLGAKSATGVLFALWGIGSFAGGALWTRGHAANRDPVGAMFWLIVWCGVLSLPLGAAPSVALLGLGLAVAGAAIAPLFGVLYALMGDVAPSGTLTEAYTLETSAIMAGIAVGSALAGVLASAVGAPATFVLAGAAYIGGGLAQRARASDLRPAAA
ncbi:MAG TPA: MFS transporter [Baekduia sp.]